MNSAQAERFQELLEEACDHYQEYDGGTVIAGAFEGTVKGGQCPLTCLFGNVVLLIMVEECNKMLDTNTITSDELWAFIYAFDGVPAHPSHKKFVSAILVGRALREKYIKP